MDGKGADGTLATKAYAGVKPEKSHFTPNLCCNASGVMNYLAGSLILLRSLGALPI